MPFFQFLFSTKFNPMGMCSRHESPLISLTIDVWAIEPSRQGVQPICLMLPPPLPHVLTVSGYVLNLKF